MSLASTSATDAPIQRRSPHELLTLCRPLADPVRVLSKFVFWSTVVMSVLFCLWIASEISTGLTPGVALLVGTAALCVGLAGPLALWLLLKQPRKNTVLYLRAFRSDAQAVALRCALKAALGGSYRVCGIRPPCHRASWLWRLFFTIAVALRYIG